MLTAVRKGRLAAAALDQTQLSLFSSTASADRNRHQAPDRVGPPPIQVLLTESAGRGVFATRRIGAGEVIHTAKPFVTHPTSSAIDSVCYFCLRKIGSKGGSFCSEACREQARGFCEIEREAKWEEFDEYCSMASRLQHYVLTNYNLHNMVRQGQRCSIYVISDDQNTSFSRMIRDVDLLLKQSQKQLITNGLKYPYLAKRLACMVIAGVASPDSLNILQPANLSQHMITEMGKECSLLRNALMTNVTKEQISFLNDEWYVNVLARIRINAFRIELAVGSYEDFLASAAASVEAEAAVGNAVYIVPSFYNHDCDPNTHIVWIDNADAKLKSLRDIDQGEELRICYIDASMDHEARQRLLLGGFGFQCQCPRCLSSD